MHTSHMPDWAHQQYIIHTCQTEHTNRVGCSLGKPPVVVFERAFEHEMSTLVSGASLIRVQHVYSRYLSMEPSSGCLTLTLPERYLSSSTLCNRFLSTEHLPLISSLERSGAPLQSKSTVCLTTGDSVGAATALGNNLRSETSHKDERERIVASELEHNKENSTERGRIKRPEGLNRFRHMEILDTTADVFKKQISIVNSV